MENIRLKGISLEQFKKNVERQKAEKCLMTKGVIKVEEFEKLFEKSFTEGIIQVIGTSKEDLEKYLGLTQSNIEDWERIMNN